MWRNLRENPTVHHLKNGIINKTSERFTSCAFYTYFKSWIKNKYIRTIGSKKGNLEELTVFFKELNHLAINVPSTFQSDCYHHFRSKPQRLFL